MKLIDAIDIAKACGLTTIGEAVFNIKIHAMNIFTYGEETKEISELEKEASLYDADTLIENFKQEALTFRKLEQDDLINLANLYCSNEDIDVTQEYYESICDMHLNFTGKGNYIFGVFDNENEGKLIGAVTVQLIHDFYPKANRVHGLLTNMVISHAKQRRGIGTKLINTVFAKLESEGVETIKVHLLTNNWAMQSMCSRLNMERTETYVKEINE